MRLFALLALSCGGCVTNCPWTFDAIGQKESPFHSTKLTYQEANTPLQIEWIHYPGKTDLFLNLTQFSLNSSQTKLTVAIQGEDPIEENVSPLEGKMRLKVPEAIDEKMTRALQDGKKVVILIDTFQTTIEPDLFEKWYEKMTASPSFLETLIKGPLS